ncbi:site-specific integrase [Anaerocolumna sp.]|uniref:site-specific integrase n=1 Tax=Anaerocolumna sp. TaxID=2041569 RepID=UPI0028A9206C|nr:site-specific integrase [Anaerocolumna sp.]
MAKAKKLPSGSWRALAYSHSIVELDGNGNVIYDENGKPKKKRIYESFTSDNPTLDGKKEAEYLAAEFALNKKKRSKPENLTLVEAIDKYITSSDAVLSPTTIQGYDKIKRNSYQELMDVPLKNITQELLQIAVNNESKRHSKRNSKTPKTISPKTVKNSYGLLTAVLNRYCPSIDCDVQLPAAENKIKELIPPEIIMDIVKGTEIELPALLAMWLSLSLSEIRGLKKSTSIKDGYLIINEVVVDVNCEPIRKQQAKTFTRIRKHKIPEYIEKLIYNTNTDDLITMSGHAIYMRFRRLLKKNNLPHMTFHDLRHVNASVMALLRIPDKYAMERGGWKTDEVMKKVYTHTFSKEREIVDEVIDDYFQKMLQVKNENVDIQKYKAWLTLFGKPDNEESMNEFKEFMQHEMQHE